MAKCIMRIEAIDGFAGLGLERGGFWEDRGYEWKWGFEPAADSLLSLVLSFGATRSDWSELASATEARARTCHGPKRSALIWP